MHVHERIAVNRPRSEIYAFWRNLTQLPLFMEHLISVEGDPYGITHWKAKSLVGTVDWDAKVVEDKPNEMISWRSLEDSDVRNSGAVRFFETSDGGTEIEVDISYDPPLGPLGVAVSKIFGEAPNQEVAKDLRAFKQIMESGVVDVAKAGTIHTQAKPDPIAKAGIEELDRSRDVTRAVSSNPEYEGVDVKTASQEVFSDAGVTITGRATEESVAYPAAGVVGTSAAARPDVFVEDAAPKSPAGSAGVATDVDPALRGIRAGKDQDKLDGNDRDVAERDSSAPI
jgi:hypothetical protein